MRWQRRALYGALPRLRPTDVVTWQNNTGLTTQASASLDNTWFASGGIRLERDSRLPGNQVAALPMLGLAAVRDYGRIHRKAARCVRRGDSSAGDVPTLDDSAEHLPSTQPAVGAEKQAGTEAGFDVAFRQSLSLRVTRFDQRASGLIQQVALPVDSNPLSRRMRYELENVGEISNRGWEMEASANLARLTVSGTLSFVDSRVENLATGYNGDLMTGDRMLQVPSRTGALNVTYTGRRWFATLGGSRALDWINYDELGCRSAYLSDNHATHELVGQQLPELLAAVQRRSSRSRVGVARFPRHVHLRGERRQSAQLPEERARQFDDRSWADDHDGRSAEILRCRSEI